MTTSADVSFREQVIKLLSDVLFESHPSSRKEALSWVFDAMACLRDTPTLCFRFAKRVLRELVPNDDICTRALLAFFCEYCPDAIVTLISPSSWRDFFLIRNQSSSKT